MRTSAPAGWYAGQLGDFIELKRGYDLPSRERRYGPFPIVSSSGPSGTHAEAKVKGPGVVTGRYGTIGQVFFVESDYWPLNTALYVLDFKGSDPRFVSYFLRSIDFFKYVDKAAVPGVNRNHVHLEEVVFPPLPEQRRIAAILGALDDKIELNRKMNRTLEEMAQALFKSWFIDFDGHDDLVDSEIGPVPRGWGGGSLGDVALLNPQSWSARTRPAEISYVDLANTKWGVIESVTEYAAGDAPSRAQRVLRAGDTLIGTVRPGNGSFALVAREGLTGSTGFAVLRPRTSACRTFVYLAATRSENIDRLAHLADGGAYPAVRPEIVAATPVVVAPDDVLTRFAALADPLLDRFAANLVESDTLATLRDTLLPKLISGELRVPEAEAAVSEAL